MRVLVTGASGYLGHAVMWRLRARHDVMGWGWRHVANGMEPVDLRNADALRSALAVTPVDAVVHCAAYRDPDFCERNPDETRQLNVAPVRVLAHALPPGAHLLLVSTDYVFEGTHPPYVEEDTRRPVNIYGQSKLEGEDAASERPEHLILRIPLLIGCGPDFAASGFIAKIAQALRDGNPISLDDCAMRFPTDIDDVAAVIEYLLASNARGIWHYSTRRGQTQYGWAMEIARLMHIDPITLAPLTTPPLAKRPANSQLATAKIERLGFNQWTDFADTVRRVLAL